MGLFYKYKCRKCGKRYFELPMNCDNCGTELVFICPYSWLPNPKPSKNCEEINEFIISLHKNRKIRELEEKINGLNVLLSKQYEENEELRKDKRETNEEIRKIIEEMGILRREKSGLLSEIMRLKIALSQKETEERFRKKTLITHDVLQAVKYATKHAHPDNGGSSEDFIRFQKCYEELTRNGG